MCKITVSGRELSRTRKSWWPDERESLNSRVMNLRLPTEEIYGENVLLQPEFNPNPNTPVTSNKIVDELPSLRLPVNLCK